jgi:ABC-type uncharacterized transport system permease subunit
MDRLPLILSTFCFLLGFVATVRALKMGRFRPHRFNLAAMGAGFLFQTVFLYQRGVSLGHCPLTNLFEGLIFVSWSITFFYLVIGRAYRLSLLGAFTEPLVFLIQMAALFGPSDTHHQLLSNRWVEMHAAFSLMAYGAFALAGVAGLMFLFQERQLKTRRLGAIFFQMPAMIDLFEANRRLLWAGFMLLSIGLAAATRIPVHPAPAALIWGGAMWVVYLGLLLARRVGPHRLAWLSMAAICSSAVALCAFNHFSQGAAL